MREVIYYGQYLKSDVKIKVKESPIHPESEYMLHYLIILYNKY